MSGCSVVLRSAGIPSRVGEHVVPTVVGHPTDRFPLKCRWALVLLDPMKRRTG
jgi:hypothetical protein